MSDLLAFISSFFILFSSLFLLGGGEGEKMAGWMLESAKVKPTTVS